MKRVASGFIVALLFFGLFVFEFALKPARAQSGTIAINPDGSVSSPVPANITTSDNVTYTFTGNNHLPIVVNRSNIIINGMGHTLQAPGEAGFSLTDMSNVTIENTTITNSYNAIYLISSSGNVLSGNNLTENSNDGIYLYLFSDNNVLSGNKVTANSYYGIFLDSSSGNTLSGNNVTANVGTGIWLVSFCDDNTLSGNNVKANGYNGIWVDGSCDDNTLSGNNITANSNVGIDLYSSSDNVLSSNSITANSYDGVYLTSSCDDNTLSGNNFTTNSVGIDLEYYCDNNVLSGNNVTANSYYGIYLDGSCDGNTLSGNNVAANSGYGIELDYSSDNIFSGNNVAANSYYGIYLDGSCDDNTLSGNNVAANSDGVVLYYSSGNRIFHNDFLNNTEQAAASNSPNTWDDGYPSGGNYWSDYLTKYSNATENDSSAIWNTPYNVSSGNIDRYPLMGPFHTFPAGPYNGITYYVNIVSNSTLSNFASGVSLENPAEKLLIFNVTGTSGTTGFCRVAIPLSLMSREWTVTVNGTPTSYSTTADLNYTYIYFTYPHSTQTVMITGTSVIPEFQPYMLLPLLMITLLTATVSKRRRNQGHKPLQGSRKASPSNFSPAYVDWRLSGNDY
jgi:parallel beta-helix repeat protein